MEESFSLETKIQSKKTKVRIQLVESIDVKDNSRIAR